MVERTRNEVDPLIELIVEEIGPAPDPLEEEGLVPRFA
jgi:hypothetical protein